MLEIGKNHSLCFKLFWNIISLALDTSQLWQDWDRQFKGKTERDIRAEFKKLNKEKGKMKSIKPKKEEP